MEAFGKYIKDAGKNSKCVMLNIDERVCKIITFITKTAFIISALVLIFNITAYKNSGFADSKRYVLVGLYYGSSSEDKYEIDFEDGLYIGKFYEKGDTEKLQEYPDAKRLAAGYYDGNVEITLFDGSGEEIRRFDLREANLFMPIDERSGKFTVKKNAYRGGVLINDLKGGMNLINYIEEEQYLYGVVGGEIGHKTNIEAQKAQAVASRSYTRVKGNTHASYGFDICSTPHCQLYKGFNGESENVRRAVDDTYGETVKYKGETVAAFYSKNSGGYTSSSEDIWGGKLGYLQAVKDEYSPDFPWKKIFTKQEIENKILDIGKSIGSLEAISIDERSRSGAVSKITFIGRFGNVALEKDKIRTTLGVSGVKSLIFTFNGNFDKVDVKEDNVATNDESSKLNIKPVYVLDNFGLKILKNKDVEAITNYYGDVKVKTLELSGANVISASGINRLDSHPIEKTEENTGEIKPKNIDIVKKLGGEDYIKASSEILITGLGYGHGVGMSQDGAIQMGKQGFTYKDILKYYYKDITIE